MAHMTIRRACHGFLDSRPLQLYLDGAKLAHLLAKEEQDFVVVPGYHILWFRLGDISSNELLIVLSDSDRCLLECRGDAPSLQQLLNATLGQAPVANQVYLTRIS